jgi:hypothetical protein
MSAGAGAEPPTAFYCVSSDVYFLGAVGLVNSLRIAGHEEPVFVLDCGLSRGRRELLEREATVIDAPEGGQPFALKTVAPLTAPAGTMVLIDADMIVTRPLTELIERAAAGNVVAFRNKADRHFPEWGELLDLGEVRRQPYVSSGLVAMGRSPGEEVLRLMQDRQHRVDLERTYFADHADDYPLLYSDQDILNAILASRVDAGRLAALDPRLCAETPFRGLAVVDVERPRAAYEDGTEPYVVHHALSPKPWQRPAYDGVYTRLLRRLLTAADVAILVDEDEIPRWLRRGPLAYAERQRIKARDQVRWRVGGLMGRR